MTTEQLKEILKPMGKFTKIAMRCTQEQWEAIKPKLNNFCLYGVNYEIDKVYLTNWFGNEEQIDFTWESNKRDYNREVHEEWNEEIFLKACGIEGESLHQQLQKAEAEVKRLQSLIEEENNIKVGDWVKRTYNGIELFKADHTHDYRYINSERHIYQKITNPEIINLLENLYNE